PAYRSRSEFLFGDRLGLFILIHLHNIAVVFRNCSCCCSHVTLTIEGSAWFNLELSRVEISFHHRLASELKQVLGPDIARNLANYISLVAGNITFNHAIHTNYDPGSTLYVANYGTINSKITVAVNITLESCACAY